MKHDFVHLKADYVQGEIMLILILRSEVFPLQARRGPEGG